jgi:hypothetical protein
MEEGLRQNNLTTIVMKMELKDISLLQKHFIKMVLLKKKNQNCYGNGKNNVK